MSGPPADHELLARHPGAGLFLSKTAAVLGWCGGPMVLCEVWTPALGRPAAFAVTLLPQLVQAWGWLHLEDGHDSLWAARSIRASEVANTLLSLGQAAGLLVLLAGLHRADLALHALGTAVGLGAAGLHARRASAWLAVAGEIRTRDDLGLSEGPNGDDAPW
jgi:hypothetical protein